MILSLFQGDSALALPADKLPEFEKPPVAEVALSVQFDPLLSLTPLHLGLLWKSYRSSYPQLEVHPPRPPAVERFGIREVPQRGFRIEVVDSPPSVRAWFLNEAGSELVQVQQDRFVFNWRKHHTDGIEEYPRYPEVKQRFQRHVQTFSDFLREEHLGRLEINQCEVTYLNHITKDNGWGEQVGLHEVITLWSDQQSEDYLPDPEDVRFTARYVLRRDDDHPIGRLTIATEPGIRASDKSRMLILRITARGAPAGPSLGEALAFLDRGRAEIVRSFAAVTTHAMHEKWGRRQ
jgi:uncharacterized protein (TIGR04255 family)